MSISVAVTILVSVVAGLFVIAAVIVGGRYESDYDHTHDDTDPDKWGQC